MTAVETYQTINQEAYWGGQGHLVDVGKNILSAPVASSLSTVARVVLGETYPQISVTRVDYRVTLTSMAATAAQALRTRPEATLAVVQTDAGTAMVMDGVVTGLPISAGNAGIITSTVPIAPAGPVWRCTATEITAAGDETVTDGGQVFMLVVEGSAGDLIRGSLTQGIAGPGILDMGTDGASVTIPAGVAGWLLEAEKAEAGL